MKYWRALRENFIRLAFLDRLAAVSHACVIVAAIAGIAFFLLERQDTQNQSRREMALQFISLSYSNDVRAAKQASNSYILAHVGQFSEARQQRMTGQVSSFKLPPEATDVFLQRLEFYDQVLICRALEQCDKTLVDTIFRNDICNFGDWLQIVLPQLESNFGPGIADRLKLYCTGTSSSG